MIFGPKTSKTCESEENSTLSTCSSMIHPPSNIQNIYNLEIGLGKRNPNKKTENNANVTKSKNDEDGNASDGRESEDDQIQLEIIQQQIELEMEEDEFLREYQIFEAQNMFDNSIYSESDESTNFRSFYEITDKISEFTPSTRMPSLFTESYV